MRGWTSHTGFALALPLENVDTDQLIPARFMSVPRRDGYGDYLLHDLRSDAQGNPVGDMPLNLYPGASILVAGRNFGCGSSREAAVYALVDAGFRAVIAPSFGDIFSANAINNGLLPARVSLEDGRLLFDDLATGTRKTTINLADSSIITETRTIKFDLDETWRTKLMNGWDDIDLTLAETDRIAGYRAKRMRAFSWIWSEGVD